MEQVKSAEPVACPFCGLPAHKIHPMGDRISGAKAPPYYGPNKVRYVCSALYGKDHHLCHGDESFDTEAEAVAAWNQRVTPQPAAVDGLVEAEERYQSAVKGRQDFRAAYRRELAKVRAFADWLSEELAAIEQLSVEQKLSSMAVLRQALRLYQMRCHRLKAGETYSWSGDAQRAADFAGPLAQIERKPEDGNG